MRGQTQGVATQHVGQAGRQALNYIRVSSVGGSEAGRAVYTAEPPHGMITGDQLHPNSGEGRAKRSVQPVRVGLIDHVARCMHRLPY